MEDDKFTDFTVDDDYIEFDEIEKENPISFLTELLFTDPFLNEFPSTLGPLVNSYGRHTSGYITNKLMLSIYSKLTPEDTEIINTFIHMFKDKYKNSGIHDFKNHGFLGLLSYIIGERNYYAARSDFNEFSCADPIGFEDTDIDFADTNFEFTTKDRIILDYYPLSRRFVALWWNGFGATWVTTKELSQMNNMFVLTDTKKTSQAMSALLQKATLDNVTLGNRFKVEIQRGKKIGKTKQPNTYRLVDILKSEEK